MMPQVGGRGPNVLRKEHIQWKASNEDLTAILALRTVTWFVQRRGIALHYFPIVPGTRLSHGCVRIESVGVARLIQDNSIVDDTEVVVSGTWTKPRKQWD